MERRYVYLGDGLTREDLRGARCRAVLDERGKCICSRHTGTMLVVLDSGERSNVLRRQLRKMEGSSGVASAGGPGDQRCAKRRACQASGVLASALPGMVRRRGEDGVMAERLWADVPSEEWARFPDGEPYGCCLAHDPNRDCLAAVRAGRAGWKPCRRRVRRPQTLCCRHDPNWTKSQSPETSRLLKRIGDLEDLCFRTTERLCDVTGMLRACVEDIEALAPAFRFFLPASASKGRKYLDGQIRSES
jgi:hypothetical protein